MNADTPVTVIVLNRDRLSEPGRTLKALSFQQHRNFEVVVVSNQLAALQSRYPLMGQCKTVDFAPANISAARNAGIAQATGQIIAFCDDDGVPEPTWLTRLIAPFQNPTLGAAGGLVIGRNGISTQWGLTHVRADGFDETAPEPLDTTIFPPNQPKAVKTAGTNCAFRREALVQTGLFDEAYAFYLDEADLNMRLNRSDWATAYVPGARVNHAFAPSAMRQANRAPKDLTQLGASLSVFLAKHESEARRADARAAFEEAQRLRLRNFIEMGHLEPADIAPLLKTLHNGFEIGATRNSHTPAIGETTTAFKPFTTGPAPEHITLTARLFTRRKQARRAKALAAKGHAVTLIEVLPSSRALTRRFCDDGYWHHRVGQFGRFERDQPRPWFRWNAQTARLEIAKIAKFR